MTQVNPDIERLSGTLDAAIGRLAQSRAFAKGQHQVPTLEIVGRMLRQEHGLDALFERAAALDEAGLFAGSVWNSPNSLLPQLVGPSLEGDDPALFALESMNLLRFLSIATGRHANENLQPDHAYHFLSQTLALNLRKFFHFSDETSRQHDDHAEIAERLLKFISSRIGLRDVLGVLVSEIWRILEQRPVQTGTVKEMITQIALALNQQGSEPGSERLGAERLISALFGPTMETLADPGVDQYLERLSQLDEAGLSREASGFARSMQDTGLVSDYHVTFVLWALDYPDRPFIPEALGLGSTGLNCWRHFRGLIENLIRGAVTISTPQAVYGLAMLLERGILHHAPVAPALQRILRLEISPENRERIGMAFGVSVSAETHLLADLLQILGLPLGVGQGANPTCQSARALSMWSICDPDFIMHLIVQAAETGNVQMEFEGQAIDSASLPAGLAGFGPIDADAVSILLVPHLDRIYADMGRRCLGRPGDPHRWINPEFHGWWVARDCAVAVDVTTGRLEEYDRFVARFFASYHPEYNGDRPLIHPQPAGIAFTDSSARFIGWHAITILRVAPGRDGEMRVYFFNPNNDSGQDWGNGVQVTTGGNGERHGEGSLEFEQFLSRLYLFHDQPFTASARKEIDQATVNRVLDLATGSWALDRMPELSSAAAAAPSA